MCSTFRSQLNHIPDEERPLLVFLGLLRRLTSSIPQLLKSVTDGRVQKKTHYSMAECVFSALMMFVTGMKSRRTQNALLRGRRIGQLFRVITGGSQQTVPHCDTVEKAFRKSTPSSLQNLRTRLVQSLIRKKVFDSYRLLGLYLVMAVDGTRYFSRSRRHCDRCLTTRHNDHSTTYYHASLEASIVGSNRLMFPVMTEFIENRNPKPHPQDCELNAFHRLARNLYLAWPRLSLLLTLDALYACGPVFTICRKYGWHFIATMKDGSLPDIYVEFLARRTLHPGNRIRRKLDSGEIETYTWVNDLHHCGVDRQSHRIHVLECSVTDSTGRRRSLFRWVISLEITAETAMAIANHGGRIRWNTEEGFKSSNGMVSIWSTRSVFILLPPRCITTS